MSSMAKGAQKRKASTCSFRNQQYLPIAASARKGQGGLKNKKRNCTPACRCRQQFLFSYAFRQVAPLPHGSEAATV